MTQTVHIIGAGPAGLTAARELVKSGITPLALEMGDHVGGISRTEVYKGYRFDIGGHRFYTQVAEIQALWHEVLGDNFVKRPRLSRIFYDGKFYRYPLDLVNTFSNLGLIESALSFFSYIGAQLSPRSPEDTFEDWVINRFGKRLFDRFFRTYTEKVWGIPVTEIRADWAAQRIKDLSFRTAVWNALVTAREGDEIKTLINYFHYPALGPGMMWEAFRNDVERRGGTVRLRTRVVALHHHGQRVETLTVTNDAGQQETLEVSNVISTMPLRQLIHSLQPPPPIAVLDAADHLKYRDLIVVCLIVDKADLFPDNWIYVHSSQVKVGRIQNFKNWSQDMVPDRDMSSLGMEYFCSQGDSLWQQSDSELIRLATAELVELGLVDAGRVTEGFVIRQSKAYPVYDATYQQNVQIIQAYLAEIKNLQTVGRNGLHRYNNQDHSMLTGLLAARNIIGEDHDLWTVNTERSYYESFTVENKRTAALVTSDPR